MTDDGSALATRGRTLTDGGLETSLIFLQRVDLPAFAAFPLLDTAAGRRELTTYFQPYLALAAERRASFILDTPTWRANPDWGAQLGYSGADLARIDRDAVAFARELAGASNVADVRVDGVVGPRGDGYVVASPMTADVAEAYHRPQVEAFAAAGADLVSAVTMSYAAEGIGVARASASAGLPAVISFTVETDGRLPDGTDLQSAIDAVDAAAPGAVAWFMVNCAHPSHVAPALLSGGAWVSRIGALRANASMMSHAELDAAPELDEGDPADLGIRYRALDALVGGFQVLGGCCGTDVRHVAAVDAAVPWRGSAV